MSRHTRPFPLPKCRRVRTAECGLCLTRLLISNADGQTACVLCLRHTSQPLEPGAVCARDGCSCWPACWRRGLCGVAWSAAEAQPECKHKRQSHSGSRGALECSWALPSSPSPSPRRHYFLASTPNYLCTGSIATRSLRRWSRCSASLPSSSPSRQRSHCHPTRARLYCDRWAP